MRFLPYLLVLAMGAPVFVWFLVNSLMVKGSSTSFAGGDMTVVVTLGLCMLAAFGLLARWMDKVISKTRG